MEQQSIERARDGDRAAQEELVRAYYGYVMGYLVKLTLNRELAMDLTQDTFVRALRALPKWRGEAKIGSWLIAIAHNLYRDHLRAVRKAVPIDDVPLPDGDTGSDDMDRREQAREALEMLALLPPDRREMVVLRYYYGYTSREIAALMRIPEGTVRSRLHYALQSLTKGKEG